MKKDSLNEQGSEFNQNPHKVLVEHPLLNNEVKHVHGKYADHDEEETEDDLILGDEDLEGDEMEFEIELEDDDFEDEDISEDDLILDPGEDLEDEDETDEDL